MSSNVIFSRRLCSRPDTTPGKLTILLVANTLLPSPSPYQSVRVRVRLNPTTFFFKTNHAKWSHIVIGPCNLHKNLKKIYLQSFISNHKHTLCAFPSLTDLFFFSKLHIKEIFFFNSFKNHISMKTRLKSIESKTACKCVKKKLFKISIILGLTTDFSYILFTYFVNQ